jgi:hypothetical protein
MGILRLQAHLHGRSRKDTDMKDSSGKVVRVNCRVSLWEGYEGRVVVDFDSDEYADGFSERDWTDKKTGIMIEADSGDFFHYEVADEDFKVLTAP